MAKALSCFAIDGSLMVALASGGQQKTSTPMKGAASQAAAAASDPGKPVAITGGKLLTITHGTIENGVVVIENGTIAAVGEVGSVKVTAGAQVIDAKSLTVYPGLIA
jgi:imidazolonepropionase-like amidohydrolase